MPRATYTGGFAAVHVLDPATGSEVGVAVRGEPIDIPDHLVSSLSGDFEVDEPPKKSNTNPKEAVK